MTMHFKLKAKDRNYLNSFIKLGKQNAKEMEHGYILLALDKKKSCSEIMDFILLVEQQYGELKTSILNTAWRQP